MQEQLDQIFNQRPDFIAEPDSPAAFEIQARLHDLIREATAARIDDILVVQAIRSGGWAFRVTPTDDGIKVEYLEGNCAQKVVIEFEQRTTFHTLYDRVKADESGMQQMIELLDAWEIDEE